MTVILSIAHDENLYSETKAEIKNHE